MVPSAVCERPLEHLLLARKDRLTDNLKKKMLVDGCVKPTIVYSSASAWKKFELHSTVLCEKNDDLDIKKKCNSLLLNEW